MQTWLSDELTHEILQQFMPQMALSEYIALSDAAREAISKNQLF